MRVSYLRQINLSWLVVSAAAAFSCCLISGCGSGDEQPLSAPAADNLPKPPESLERRQSPVNRSQRLTDKVNLYRSQTFDGTLNVDHKNVLYTAAYRHAQYLNTVNSAAYSPSSSISGSEGTSVTPDSELEDLRDEGIAPAASPTTFPYPALYTNNDLYSRLRAVAGSGEMLGLSPGVRVMEDYVFNGNISNPEDETGASEFRGFNLDTRSQAEPSQYQFDEADNLWYSRHGRLLVMRAATRFIGYAAVADGNYPTPWPLFGGRFKGVWISVSSSSLVAQTGYWPNQGNTNVNPYGLDTDVEGRISYCGPPIHVTLPVAEPFLFSTSTTGGVASATVSPAAGIRVALRKLEVTPSGEPQSRPVSAINRSFKVSWNIGNTTAFYTTFQLGDNDEYEYFGEDSFWETKPGFEMRDGEFFMVPTEPLEPDSWYEVGIRLRTASHSFGDNTSPDQPLVWRFKTNSNTPPVTY